MENHISHLENYTIKSKGAHDNPVERCRFFYVHNDNLWKEFDVEGYQDLESAFELAKDAMADDVVQMALKESIRSLDIPSKNFHFKKDGEIEDLRDYTFDKGILDKDSELFGLFKQLLLDNWNEDMSWYFFRVDCAKNVNIHDDTDKKRVYDHYFDGLNEFEDRTSFLEYYNTINLDYDGSVGNQKIHYDSNKYGDYYCIDDTVNRDDLYHFLYFENGIHIKRRELLINFVTWGAFAYYYGMNNGLSDIESRSFAATVVACFTCGFYYNSMGLPECFRKDVDTKKYFKEHLIYDTVEGVLSRRIPENRPDYAKEIFFTIFDVYKNHIQHFEYKTKRLEFRVSQRQYDMFMALKGESKSDKLNNLIEFPTEIVVDSLLPDISFEVESVNDWLDCNVVFDDDEFGPDGISDWLSSKPSLEWKYGEEMEIDHINFEFGYISREERFFVEGDMGEHVDGENPVRMYLIKDIDNEVDDKEIDLAKLGLDISDEEIDNLFERDDSEDEN